jgi:hypothetical protein
MVRLMVIRMYAVGLVVIIGLGLALAPNQAFGRSGGFGGRSFAIAPAFRPPVLQRSLGFRSPALRQSVLLRRHRFGFGVPLTGFGGSYYDPSDNANPYYQSSYAYPDMATGDIPVGYSSPVIHHRGCDSQSVTVPSESGGERSVNIVRCY